MKKTISILAFFLISSAVLVPVVTTSCDDNEKKYLIMNYGHDPFGMGTSNSAAYAAYYNGTRYLGADLEFTYTPQFEFISSAHTSFIYEL
ncbi:MAG: hypothetical protein LBV69_09715 [Bacteroidales bacterium]|jgi:hypothetical protein|nr:hypothetical protein [Bacteroidales bacterium]